MSEETTSRKTAYEVAKEKSRAMARNVHVRALTVRQSQLNVGSRSRPQKELNEYWLRRMWATLLLHDLQNVLDWSWDRIEEHTGRTKQSWHNVTQGKIPDGQYFLDRYSNTAAITGPGRPKRHNDPDVYHITRTFIHEVTTELERVGNIETELFRDAWDQGMRTYAEDLRHVADPDDRKQRRNEVMTIWQSWGVDGADHPNPNHFPLFRRDERDRQREECESYLIALERCVWGRDAVRKGKEHRRRSEREFKAVNTRMMDEERKQGGGVTFVDPKVDHMAAMGFVHVPVTLPLHPTMVKDGRVRFMVELTVNDAMIVTGTATNHVPG